jgi:pimeloyl-ACP methyl ester carboxylesterase
MTTIDCHFDRIFVDSCFRIGVTDDGEAPAVVQLDDDLHPIGTPNRLRDAAQVLGLAQGAIWYAVDRRGRNGKVIWSFDLRVGRERREAICPRGVVPCGIVDTLSQHVCVLGLHDEAVVRLNGNACEPFWPKTAGMCPVGLPSAWGHEWSCLCEVAAGNRVLVIGDRDTVISRMTMPSFTRLAVWCGCERAVSVECTDGGHAARILFISGLRHNALELPRDPMWPISLERLSDSVVLHYSSLGRRRAVAIDAVGQMTSFAPWCRPIMKDEDTWMIRRSSPTFGNASGTGSPSLRQVRWTSHRGVAMRGWLWTPHCPTEGVVMRLHGGPGVACDHPWDCWTECLLDAGYRVFQPDLPGSCGYGDKLVHSLRGEALVRSVHEEVATAAQVGAEECSTTTDEISLCGESLGGYLALFAGMKTCGWRPRSVIAVNGFGDLLFDFNRSSDAIRGVMADILGIPTEDALRYTLASASTWAHEDVPPVLLMSSAHDTNVRPCNSARMRSILRSASVPAELVVLKNSTHDMLSPQDKVVALNAMKRFLGLRRRMREPPLLLDMFYDVAPVLNSQSLFNTTPAASDSLAVRCLKVLARTNQVLWGLEDEARAHGKQLTELGAVKKRIDLCNQRRNDLIADLDAVFAKSRRDATACDASPRTESLASALDRFTILALRSNALSRLRRASSAYRQRATADVRQNRRVLYDAIAALFADLQVGRCIFHIARPWKLYNDPILSVHSARRETP